MMMKKHILFFVCFLYGTFLVSITAQEYSTSISKPFDKLIKKGDLFHQDVQWEITSQHISSTSQINHIYFNQTLNGLQILNTESSIHLFSDGNELTSNINFIKDCSKRSIGRSTPSIGAKVAIELVAKQLAYRITEPLKLISKKQNKSQETTFSDGGISKNNISAKLKYWKNENEELVLVWQIHLLEPSLEHSWEVFTDASTGTILNKIDGVINCNFVSTEDSQKPLDYNKNLYDIPNYKEPESFSNCEECYEVLAMSLESAYFGSRSVVVKPANNIASPFGWHDTDGNPGPEFYTTIGNNVDAYIGNPENYEYRPNGGGYLDFTEYDFNEEFTVNNRFQNASITNLFYWGNIVHDVSYIYGFDEASGNFQQNNYNRGGLGNDPIGIIGQNEIDLCNASFINYRDGDSSFIKMNACGTKDGSFDNVVLIHEYAHGISIRLNNGGNGGNCFSNDEGIGEGIADWYGLMFTLSPSDIGTTPRGFATYLFDEGPNGEGVRPFPYSTDMSVNPLTYESIKEYNAFHHVGSVWGTILWDLTWKLIDEYGFDENIYNFTGDVNQDAGNIMAMAIVTEALKLQPCFPGFVDARNAIFYANQVIYGGYNECILWEVFARRGLGESAYQGSPFDFSDGFEAFDLPSKEAEFDFSLDNICANTEVISNLRGGSPPGGVYSGLGVKDDNNGRTFSFDPGIAGLGIHTITYEVPDTRCSVASFAETTIDVVIDEISPNIFCFNDVSVTIPLNEEFYEIIDFSDRIQYNDNCFSSPTISQQPVAGIPLGVGTINMNMKATDTAGNEVVCSFKLTVEKEVKEGEDILEIYPNPVTSEITLSSYKEIESLTTYIFDINGRLIQNKQFNYFGFENKLNVENLSPGMYFLKIKSDTVNIVKQIIKK